MKLTVIRHTRVEVAPGICYGQSDVPVDGTYAQELEVIRDKLAGKQFEKLFSSPLSRCSRLANDLFPRETIVYDERLMELNFGRWEMQKWDNLDQTPEAQAWFNDFVHVRTPEGESFQDQIDRTAAFLKDLESSASNQVALVTHGGIIRALHCLLNDVAPIDAFQNKVDYGDVVEFDRH